MEIKTKYNTGDFVLVYKKCEKDIQRFVAEIDGLSINSEGEVEYVFKYGCGDCGFFSNTGFRTCTESEIETLMVPGEKK